VVLVSSFFGVAQPFVFLLHRMSDEWISMLRHELESNTKSASNLQKAIGQIYSRKAYDRQSDWYKNDPLLDRMYELLTILTECLGGEFIIYAEPDLTITFPEKVLSQRS
jgi:hypothetical protein